MPFGAVRQTEPAARHSRFSTGSTSQPGKRKKCARKMKIAADSQHRAMPRPRQTRASNDQKSPAPPSTLLLQSRVHLPRLIECLQYHRLFFARIPGLV